MKAAVIDLGTNTFQMLVAQKQGSAFNVLHRHRVFVKIGQGGIQEGTITTEAWQRALSTFEQLCQLAKQHGVAIENTVATATSAIRSAGNGPELLAAMQQRTGILPKAISGDEEARLIFEGVKTVLDMGQEPHLVVDIGGGSVEIICGNQQEIWWKKSFEIGAQRLLTLFHHSEPLGSEEKKALVAHLQHTFAELPAMLKKYQPGRLVGCAGTFSTVRDIFTASQHLPVPDKGKPFRLLPADYLHLHQLMETRTLEQRLQIPGMLPERADMIVVASCVVEFLLQNFLFQQVIISPASLKEGLLSGLFAER